MAPIYNDSSTISCVDFVAEQVKKIYINALCIICNLKLAINRFIS